MRDLRVYVDPAGSGGGGRDATFYSQRAGGPYYRWVFAKGAGRWRYSRVALGKPELNVLCVAHWDAVPAALRARLDEHYLE